VGDQFRKVLPGDPLKIPAEAWNALVDLSQDQKNQRHDQLSQTEGSSRQTTLAKVRNQTGVDLDRFSIVALGAPIITPAANHIVVTADHGFLFTESAPVETDKSKIDQKPESAIVAKKRYLIGPNLGDNSTAWHGKMSQTSNVEGDMEFWIPKGANLFHFVGGARFVHGGAMPQEIIVPVITVKQIKGKSAADTKTKYVSIQVLGTNHRITTAQHRFQLIQMDAVSDRVKPITLKVAVYEGNEPVTNVQNIKFDSVSSSLDDRKKWVSLVLKDRQYNKKTPYRLVLQDAETGIEQQSVEVIIDRAFDDF
jgi:hypothetical protein